MKKCPYCAEEIQDAAAVCKHCGRGVLGVSPKEGRYLLLGVVLLLAVFVVLALVR